MAWGVQDPLNIVEIKNPVGFYQTNLKADVWRVRTILFFFWNTLIYAFPWSCLDSDFTDLWPNYPLGKSGPLGQTVRGPIYLEPL